MNAEETLKAAVLAALRADPALAAGLNEIVIGRTVKATPPYAEYGETTVTDWSTKDRAGREVRITLTLRHPDDTSLTVNALLEDVCRVIEALPADLPGWQIGSIALGRIRTMAGNIARWTGIVDYRIRMMEDV